MQNEIFIESQCREDLESQSESALLSESQFSFAYQKGLHSTVRTLQSIGATLDNAEEIAQAAWAKGWEYRFQLKDHSALRSWIATIARNLYRSWIVTEKRFDEMQEFSIPTTILQDMEAKSILQICSETESRMLNLYYLEGYTAQEISKCESLCPSSIRVRLLRIRRNLKSRMDPGRLLAA